MIINDLDDYYIVFDTKNRNTELDTLINNYEHLLSNQVYNVTICLNMNYSASKPNNSALLKQMRQY